MSVRHPNLALVLAAIILLGCGSSSDADENHATGSGGAAANGGVGGGNGGTGATGGSSATGGSPGISGASNAYFDELVAHPKHFKSYALRSQAEIDQYSQTSPNPYVLYDPALDMAVAHIEPFALDHHLANPIGASDDRITLTELVENRFISDRGIKIGDEIMTVNQPAESGSQFPLGPGTTTVLVNRGQFGTTATAHAVGDIAQISANSLRDQVRVPIDSSDGHTYFVTWEAVWTESCLNTKNMGHKAFQLADTQKSSIWLETRARYEGLDGFGPIGTSFNGYPGFDSSKDIATIDVRSYDGTLVGAEGSNMLQEASLQPQVGRFVVHPNRVVRYFWFIDQRADALDPASLWVADQDTDPVSIIDAITVSVGGAPPTIKEWYLELNTSYDRYRNSLETMRIGARNVAVLQDVTLDEVKALLVRP